MTHASAPGFACGSIAATAAAMIAVLFIALAPAAATPAPPSEQAAPTTLEHPNLPRGYEMAAYLNCGSESGTGEGPTITLQQGSKYTFDGAPGPFRTATLHPKQVEYDIRGLDPGAEYILGFTWWDVDMAGRSQSVKFGAGEPLEWTTVLPAAPAVAYFADEPTWARVLLPLTGAFSGKKRLTVAFANDSGPNAALNELWLLKRTAEPKRTRVIIVTGDDYPGHRWRETAPELAALLREDPRLEVSISETAAVFGSPLMSHYDCAVLHIKNYERLPYAQPVWTGLERYVASGKGLLLSHFACGAFQDWPGFVKVAGRVWNPGMRAHDPRGDFTVEISDPSHPVTKGMEAFTAKDELYTCLDGTTPIHVVCSATSKVDKKEYPMGFVVQTNKGRVFHCPLGHDVQAFKCDGTRQLYRRATAWAAGLDPVAD